MTWPRALAVVALLGGAYFYFRERPIPPVELPRALTSTVEEGSPDEPCAGKPRCLLVYVAPWCPSCAQARPLLLDIKERFSGSAKLGVKTVIGMDKRPALEAYAKGLGSDIFLDPEGAFSRAANVRSVPTWLVLDVRGRVLSRFSGTYPDAETQLEKLGLDPVSLVKVKSP